MIPMCYFPSTVLWLSDHNDHLDYILHKRRLFPYKFIANSQQMMMITKNTSFKTLQTNCQTNNKIASDFWLKQFLTEDALFPIHSELYNHNRFAELSVLLLTNNFLTLELLNHLSQSPFKKIALITIEQESLANNLCDQGLLDLIIVKQNDNWLHDVINSVAQLQMQYFQEMTQRMVKILNVSLPAYLQTSAFIAFFRAFCQDKHIVEYYILDQSGHFILLDASGCVYILHDDDIITQISNKQKLEQNIFAYNLYWEERDLDRMLLEDKIYEST